MLELGVPDIAFDSMKNLGGSFSQDYMSEHIDCLWVMDITHRLVQTIDPWDLLEIGTPP